ncbi:hypothetical protein EI94DRAFT_1124360 [Lactarius quietus]|nr:hypothetical protein EI94DRAFT_1124360 [Lactarius quietus]
MRWNDFALTVSSQSQPTEHLPFPVVRLFFPVRGHWSLTRSGLSQNNTLGLVQPKVARQLNLSLPSRFRVHLSSDNRLCLLRTMHSLRNPKPFYHQELGTSITGFLPLSGSNHLTAHTNRLPQSTNTYLARTTCLFCHNPSMKPFRLTKSLLIPPSLISRMCPTVLFKF